MAPRKEVEGSTSYDEREEDLFTAIGRRVQDLEIDDTVKVTRFDEGNEAEDDRAEAKVVDKIESLCMNCEDNGETRLLLTKIPKFREVILSSFCCNHCGYKNTEVSNAGEIQQKGCKYSLTLHHPIDMEREVIKTETAIFRIEDLDFEIPPGHGKITNIEGLLSEILTNLEAGQKARKTEQPELFEKIGNICKKLLEMMIGRDMPFTVSVNDPAGNSWIEPSTQDDEKGKYVHQEYPRSREQNAALGLGEADQVSATSVAQAGSTAHLVPQIQSDGGDPMADVEILDGAVYGLDSACPGCSKPAKLNVQLVNIPFFKEVVVSAMNCEHCGYKTSDVKTGGEVPEKGKRLTLKVSAPEDLSRDVLKSESATMHVPECDIEMEAGTMGGRFTTIEGVLTQVRSDLRKVVYGEDDDESLTSDGMQWKKKEEWSRFFERLDNAIACKLPFTCIMEDPLANSYIQSLTAPEPDPKLIEEEYTRTSEEIERLGLADMKTKFVKEGEYEPEIIAHSVQDSGGQSQAEKFTVQEDEEEEL
ncbi:MAG: hypothetical protein Q9195_005282 [Heterodermia aff. obscurata]